MNSYKCKDCRVVFSNPVDMRQHNEQLHPERLPKEKKCKFCDYKVDSDYKMLKHRREEHPDKVRVYTKTDLPKTNGHHMVELVACPQCGCRLDVIRKALELANA